MKRTPGRCLWPASKQHLGPAGSPLLQDIYDEVMAKAAAQAQSATAGDLMDPSTKDTPPAQEGGPSPAHMVMAPYSTLDEVTGLAAAAHIYC